jgi:hypothetical protein
MPGCLRTIFFVLAGLVSGLSAESVAFWSIFDDHHDHFFMSITQFLFSHPKHVKESLFIFVGKKLMLAPESRILPLETLDLA